MKIDLYTKILLTVIAACLVAIVACDSGFSADSGEPMSRAEAERICRESWGAEENPEFFKECVDKYVTFGGGWE